MDAEIKMENPDILTLKKESVRIVVDVIGLNWYHQKVGIHLGELQISKDSNIEVMVKEYIKLHDGDFSSVLGCCCYIVDIYSTRVEDRKAITELFREKVYFDIDGTLSQKDKEFFMTFITMMKVG